MIKEFEPIRQAILSLIKDWKPILLGLSEDVLITKTNNQKRTIKQIIGHMVDSASNNTHRIIHLQYQKSPLRFPNYATNGNNDRWIAIQNYNEEEWEDLVQLWKYSHAHIAHVILNTNPEKLDNKWNSESEYGKISLKAMIIDFLRHFKMHLSEINELIK